MCVCVCVCVCVFWGGGSLPGPSPVKMSDLHVKFSFHVLKFKFARKSIQ